MSSTNRSDARDFHVSDFYVTPIPVVEKFLTAWYDDDGPEIPITRILDPCAGGQIKDGQIITPMSYPTAIQNLDESFKEEFKIDTMDIREDSAAFVKADYLNAKFGKKYDMIISNPPFATAMGFINKGLEDVVDAGYVIYLLRLNFFGSEKRFDFFKKTMPIRCYVHSKRIGFTSDGKTDSIEYMHCIFRKGYNPKFTEIRVI